jgi:hypothetical protein
MRAVNVGIHCREAIGKTLGDETLCSKVIAFIEFVLADYIEDTRVTFKGRTMENYLIKAH